MPPPYEPIIGLEVHVELLTRTKMFCACPVVDPTRAEPNTAVCEVCAGMPGTLPTLNAGAVELAVRVALALGSRIAPESVFARKNYFYPDLPKGYQISQYESPLAEGGSLPVPGDGEERSIRIRRVHLEEDTGKLVHLPDGSRVDFNRAGVPLLEIVTEPDLHSLGEARAFALELRALLRTLEVTSGDMEKGAIRFEANVSVRPAGTTTLGVRTEIKNLNSFRSMARAVAFEIERQSARLAAGQPVEQETRGWDEARGETLAQRDKEDAHDYRYFPEPDLPPLRIDPALIETVRRGLPELPASRRRRFVSALSVPPALAAQLAEEPRLASYFEEAVASAPAVPPEKIAYWIAGELSGLLAEAGQAVQSSAVSPQALAELVAMVETDAVSGPTAKALLARIFRDGGSPASIVEAEGLGQVSDVAAIDRIVAEVLAAHPDQVEQYRRGKSAISQWLFGQVMRRAEGRAKPALVSERLAARLGADQNRAGG
jgi:aspartyl-tRNA(Asn)/glutamyl-tRNA(Gln) amidotransferase subunit B